MGKRAMAPHRVVWRLVSGGKGLPTKRKLKAKFGPKPVARQSQANHDRMMAGRKPTASKAAAKKSAARKPSVYEQAKAIPAQNRAAAKKAAAPAARKSVPVRLANGQFDGRKAMNPRDLEQFERLEKRAGVPEQQIRPLLRRKG